jgi:hypothetical protein
MSRGVRISIIILSAILISSCAANRIQVSGRKDLSCITPKTRYDFGRNLPVRALKSNSRKYTRYVYHASLKNKNIVYLSGKINGKDRAPYKLISSSGETYNSRLLTTSDINELMILQEILKSSEINLNNYELKKLPDPANVLNEPGDVFIGSSQEAIPIPGVRLNGKSGNSHVVIKQSDIDGIKTGESVVKAGESIQISVNSDKPKVTPSQKSGTFVFVLAVLAGLIPLAALKTKPGIAANISFWAAMNPWKTRLMFAAAQIGLGTAAFFLGEKLAYNGIHFSDLSRDLLIGTFLTSSVLYPVKNAPVSFLKHSYLRQKAFDLALAVSGFMLIANAGNDPGMRASFTSMAGPKGHEQQQVNMLNDNSQVPKQLLYYQNGQQLQDEQTVSPGKKPGEGLKILYSILVFIAALVLGVLLAAAACGLSCNGMEGLAYLVGIGGGVLLIGLTIWVIKSIWHPRRVKPIKPPEDTDPIPQGGAVQI